MIDAIIPTIRGREQSLERLTKSLHENTPAGMLNFIIIEDSETCGWGWRKGLEKSKEPYVLLACDDQMCVSDVWYERAIEAVDADLIACPRVWLPDGNIESNGGDMKSFAHVSPQPKRDWSRVDYTTIPFLSRKMADEIGMLDVHYASDVYVSYRGRQLGYQTALRHGFDMCHFQEAVGRGAGMTQGDRDAMDCRTVAEALGMEYVEATGAIQAFEAVKA